MFKKIILTFIKNISFKKNSILVNRFNQSHTNMKTFTF